jgi:hypothetical protein
MPCVRFGTGRVVLLAAGLVVPGNALVDENGLPLVDENDQFLLSE